MELCKKCAAIPARVFTGTLTDKAPFSISDLAHILHNSQNCAFCKFLVEAYKLAYDLPPESTIPASRDICAALITLPRDSKSKTLEEPWHQQIGVDCTSKGKPGPTSWLQFSDDPSYLRKPLVCISYFAGSSVDATPGGFRKISPDILPRRRDPAEVASGRLDYARIQKWMHICQSQHGGECAEGTAFTIQSLQLRLINVRRRTIEIVKPAKQYLTLSYVWGDRIDKQSLIDFWSAQDPNTTINLPTHLPQTIEDAIEVTQNLGYDYLWVDAFCINQIDKDELDKQINIMHLVFECAVFTIAAMDGESHDAGLAGVSRSFKQMQQPTCKLKFGEVMATYVQNVIHRPEDKLTPWETRAWTLQELLLSKRVIFFDKHYLRMRCHSEFFHDLLEIGDSLNRPLFQQSNKYFWENGFSVDLHDSKFFLMNFDNLLTNLTRRCLSVQSDAIKACQGAFNRMEQLTGVSFVQGLPRSYLHLALLWHTFITPATQRAQFPSWSWAGWDGRAEYLYCLDDLPYYESLGPIEKRKSKYKKRRNDSPEKNFIFRNSSAVINIIGDKLLQISSQCAQVRAQKVRDEGQTIAGLPDDTDYSSSARGDHWAVLARNGAPLSNDIGLLQTFGPIDYSFRLHADISAILNRCNGRCELVFIQYFPWLRDRAPSGPHQWVFDHIGCLVVQRDEESLPALRLGMLFVKLEDWINLNPQSAVITIG